MKKSELIKKLESIEGDPDILFWNGFVGDYQHLGETLTEVTLYKEDKEYLRSIVNLERSGDGIEEVIDEDSLNKLLSSRDWELPNQFFSLERLEKVYGENKKVCYVLEACSRGKSFLDRIGESRY
jgi:hypothetical protein